MLLFDRKRAVDRNEPGRVVRRDGRFHVCEPVMRPVRPMHRGHERQHRRMQQISVVEVFEKAEWKPEHHRPGQNVPRKRDLAGEHLRRKPSEQPDRERELCADCQKETWERDAMSPRSRFFQGYVRSRAGQILSCLSSVRKQLIIRRRLGPFSCKYSICNGLADIRVEWAVTLNKLKDFFLVPTSWRFSIRSLCLLNRNR